MQGQHKAILKDLKQSLLGRQPDAFFSDERIVRRRGRRAPGGAVAVADPLTAPLDLDSLPVAFAETPPPEVTRRPTARGGPGVYVMKERPSPRAPRGSRLRP
jgi:hypothetical protein